MDFGVMGCRSNGSLLDLMSSRNMYLYNAYIYKYILLYNRNFISMK